MSAEANKEPEKGMASKDPKETKGEAPGAQVESQQDRFETVLEYEPSAKMPVPVVLVWACALIGLGTYAVSFYFPELSLWVGR
jgi:hypothetical protein